MNYQNISNDSSNSLNSYNSLSWKGILAGAFLAVGLTLMINLLNLGVGLSAYVAGGEVKIISLVTFFWNLVCVFAVMFIAGYVSGSLTPSLNQARYNGAKQGLVTWSISLMLMLCLTGMLGVILPINLQAISSITNQSVQSHNDRTQIETSNNPQYQTVEQQRVLRENNASLLAALSLQAFLILFIGALASALGSELSSRNYVATSDISSLRGV